LDFLVLDELHTYRGRQTDGNDVIAALANFDTLWETLFPAEQARIARLLVERVTLSQQGLTVDLRTAGLNSVIRDMLAPRQLEKAA
jgi:hypothetical protein